MVETREDYRKKKRQQKFKTLWRSLFKASKQETDRVEKNTSVPENEILYSNDVNTDKQTLVEEKVNRLKKRLNWAILIVLGLVILVLIALFKL